MIYLRYGFIFSETNKNVYLSDKYIHFSDKYGRL